MKTRFIKVISLMSALILILIPTNINAQSKQVVQQEFYEVIERLNFESSEIKFVSLDELPSGSGKLNFKTMEELEGFLIKLQKDIENANSKLENRKIEYFKDGKWVEIDNKEYNQIINQTNPGIKSSAKFADYFRSVRTVYDKKWLPFTVAGRLDSEVYYGIERVAPRAMFVTSDRLFSAYNVGTEFKYEEQDAYATGRNNSFIMVEWSAKLYLTVQFGGIPVGGIIAQPSGVYSIK